MPRNGERERDFEVKTYFVVNVASFYAGMMACVIIDIAVMSGVLRVAARDA